MISYFSSIPHNASEALSGLSKAILKLSAISSVAFGLFQHINDIIDFFKVFDLFVKFRARVEVNIY